jgi:glucose-6-phosphate 1-dehydrogenase
MQENTSIIIFGATGDLSQSKLIPALFSLFRKRRLPEKFQILGTASRPWNNETFRSSLKQSTIQALTEDPSMEAWNEFAGHLFYDSGDFDDPENYPELSAKLVKMEKGPADRLYYLSTSPEFYSTIVLGLHQTKMLNEAKGWRRLIVEKPFGHDLSSARALNHALHLYLHESQIYRIDHYLGKDTVQNLLVFRFANGIFEPLWNRNYIDHVQISVSESEGIESRGSYYDKFGVVRDIFQNHLLQLLTLVAMEPPATYAPESLREEKVKVLNSLRPLEGDEVKTAVLYGQYQGYHSEQRVAPESQTPTYAALRAYIDNWRWQGVPFYLRSGKKLAEKCTEVIIQFNCPPHRMLPLPLDHQMIANLLVINIAPDEGIHLRFEAKVPGSVADMRSVNMEFHYRDSFDLDELPDAYERLLLDALHGDPSLFIRADQTELAWEYIDPIVSCLDRGAVPVHVYEPGSWGPVEADRFIAQDGHDWLHSCADHEVT